MYAITHTYDASKKNSVAKPTIAGENWPITVNQQFKQVQTLIRSAGSIH